MATEKKRSKGLLLYLFDWNAKSRKKLFSKNSESSEGFNRGNESVDNLVTSQYLWRELQENGYHTSFCGSDEYSCVSSINGDGTYATKAPGVVAQLMGLDAMPMTSCELGSISSYKSLVVKSSYNPKVVPFQHESHNYVHPPNKVEDFPWTTDDLRRGKNCRTTERFQTEMLPPKIAKPISITQHKLLSPIKSPGFVPTKDAAYIMEAASRIIDSSPQPTSGAKIPSVGSPSSSFRLQHLKEKMDAVQRSSSMIEPSKTPKHSASGQQMIQNSSDRYGTRSLFKNMSVETSSSTKVKNKGKSVSTRIQDKTNLQKEDSVYSNNKSKQMKEPKLVKLEQKQSTTEKAKQNRTSQSKISGALKENNDKQNCISHKDKSILETSVSEKKSRKIAPGDNSSSPSKIIKRVFVNAENRPKEAVTATAVFDKKAPPNSLHEKLPSLNRMKNISSNKQLVGRDNRLFEEVPDKSDDGAGLCGHSCQNDSRKDMDVISFTFTSPVKRSASKSLMSKAAGNNHHPGADPYKMNCQPHARSSLSLSSGLNLIDSGCLNFLLEQKLKELADKVVTNKSGLMSKGADADSVSCFSTLISAHDVVGTTLMEYDEDWQDSECTEAHNVSNSNKCEGSRESDVEHFNISISECSNSGSCVSSSIRSNPSCGYGQPSSPYPQEVSSCVSTESVRQRGDETDFAGVASNWELEYVRHILHYSGLKKSGMDVDYKLIDPGIFDLLENLINTPGKNKHCTQVERKILFDGVTEIVSSRHELVSLGSHKAWVKWGILLRNESLTGDIYKEILCLQGLVNLMLDEVVDRDMSTHYGRWLDFEIESLEEGIEIEKKIVASLIDELVVDLSVQNLYRLNFRRKCVFVPV